jgi:hypothetical protein
LWINLTAINLTGVEDGINRINLTGVEDATPGST